MSLSRSFFVAFLCLSSAIAEEPGAEDVLPAPTSNRALGPGAIPPELVMVARATRAQPLSDRIAAVSERLLDRPYINDPVGEGVGHDADPPARYDAFDCLTFVEEVSALSLAADPADAGSIRHALRYGDEPASYANRNHFMELQWIPDAIEGGWLRDTTAEYGKTITMSKTVDDATWNAWPSTSNFAMERSELPSGTMELQVLPLSRAREIASTIRPGSVVMAVRADRKNVPIWISHVGFVIEHKDGPRFRHATRLASSLRVRDNPLSWYLTHLAGYKNWPTAGIAIFELVEQGPRISAMVQPTTL